MKTTIAAKPQAATKTEVLEALGQFTKRIEPAQQWLIHQIDSGSNKLDREYVIGLQSELDEIKRLTVDGHKIIECSTEKQITKTEHKVTSTPPLSRYQNLAKSSRLFLTVFLTELERTLVEV